MSTSALSCSKAVASLAGRRFAGTPEAFERLIAEETVRWARVVAETGVRLG
jgi:hypothetical protein